MRKFASDLKYNPSMAPTMPCEMDCVNERTDNDRPLSSLQNNNLIALAYI